MDSPKKILVVQPSWVGDAAMATPTLRAIRELYPQAHITYLLKRYVKPLYLGLPWHNRLVTYRTGKSKGKAGKNVIRLARRLRAAKFDLAIILPNSFKTALMCKLAKIPRIVGYERDGRGFLLTDKLLPVKSKGKFIPSPIVKYYLGLAHYLGSGHRDLSMKLVATQNDVRGAEEVFEKSNLPKDLDRPASKGNAPLIVLNIGAQYGAAKCWRPEYFAEIADRFITELHATLLISAAPKEKRIVQSILHYMRNPEKAIDLSSKGLTLGSLKEVTRRCDLMVTNDTGPRHIAAAMDVPVVTIFGPTHPEWTEIYFPKERKVQVKVFCGPCQKKVCPLDHRCMTRVTPSMVWDNSLDLLGARFVDVHVARSPN